MRFPLQRLLLAVAVGLGVASGLARAGEPLPHPSPVLTAPAVSYSPADDHGFEGTPGVVVEDGPGYHSRGGVSLLRPRTYGQAVRSHLPLGCYGHHNDYACSSVHSELIFLFGSCRQFFGERCLKAPPGSPVPGFDSHNPEKYYLGEGPGYSYGKHGYGKHGYGRPGCIRCD